jgi:hypothetical protein
MGASGEARNAKTPRKPGYREVRKFYESGALPLSYIGKPLLILGPRPFTVNSPK